MRADVIPINDNGAAKTKIMKHVFLLIAALGSVVCTEAQKIYFSKAASVSFYSEAILEDIEAHNTTSVVAFNAGTGQIEFSVSIKAFRFKNALMQEHFNENYMESDKYPYARFKGRLAAIETVDFSKDGSYTCTAAGTLTIHGVSKPVSTPVVFTVKNSVISGSADFVVLSADYNIKIPAIVRNNIAKSITVKVSVPSFELKAPSVK